MIPISDGAHSCESCGHIVFAPGSTLECVCAKCEQLRRNRPLLRPEKRSSAQF
jgi:hypothetical protein